jgi:hypothetical protein
MITKLHFEFAVVHVVGNITRVTSRLRVGSHYFNLDLLKAVTTFLRSKLVRVQTRKCHVEGETVINEIATTVLLNRGTVHVPT